MPHHPKPPGHLTLPTARWWTEVVRAYALEGHHLRLLQAACEAWDRSQEARQIIAEAGLTFVDERGHPRMHPAVQIERDARIGFARLVRELDLDTEPRQARSRPPGLRSNDGRVG